jgi:ubiquinone biosynthesis protein UbiJ
MLTGILLRPLELALNRGVAQSTSAQALATALEGRSLALRLEATPLDLRLRVSAGRLLVAPADGTAPDARLAGTPLALLRLLRGDSQAVVRAGEVRMSGDTEIAAQFEDLLRFARPDVEEALARLLGDPIAHEAGNAVRALGAWSRAARRTLTRSLAEYLQEESAVLPTRAEIGEFARHMDELGNDVARAEARLRQLQQRLPGTVAGVDRP